MFVLSARAFAQSLILPHLVETSLRLALYILHEQGFAYNMSLPRLFDLRQLRGI